MKITLNGKPCETEAETLAGLLAEHELDGARVATAVNGTFAPKGGREAVRLGEGDTVEILAPMPGG